MLFFFGRFTAAEFSYHVFFSMKHSNLLTKKAAPVVNNSLWFLHGMKTTVGNSLHVRSNFCCLIMDLIKLMIDTVCVSHVILL